MLKEYVSIIDNPKYQIFGLTLQPLTLGHLFLFDALESPILHNPENMTIDDILLAVWICSMNWESSRDSLSETELKEKCFAWGKAWGGKADTIETETNSFFEYLNYYLQAPPRWQSDKASKETKTPWELFLITTLQREIGITEKDAWNLPCNKAFALFASVGEIAFNDDTLKTESEIDLIKNLEEKENANR